jgi:hypothetical protein
MIKGEMHGLWRAVDHEGKVCKMGCSRVAFWSTSVRTDARYEY